MAIDGDTIIAGAPGDTTGANKYQGSVYTFASTGAAERTETAKLTASAGAANDFLGTSVAVDGDTIVAGADGTDASRGSAYTFARTGPAARTETALLTASNGAAHDAFGCAVATTATRSSSAPPFMTSARTPTRAPPTPSRAADRPPAPRRRS